MKQICHAHDCPRLLGQFYSKTRSKYCPQCTERIRRGTRPTLAHDKTAWTAIDGGYMRKTHIGGAK